MSRGARNSIRLWIAALALVGACAPPKPGPEAVVQGVYDDVQQNIGHSITPISAIPMTESLSALLEQAQAAADARNEPFIDGDLAANCQDCVSLADLSIGPQSGPEAIPAARGHTLIEARFTLNGNEPRRMLYDLVETPDGWRVDNIIAEGFNLRDEAARYLIDPAAPNPSPPEP